MATIGISATTKEPVELSDEARRQGTYIVGTTGTGKTTLLKRIAIEDMNHPDRHGLCVLDPHGDFVESLLSYIPESRKDDVIYFAPADPEQRERPLGLNIFDCDRNDEAAVGRVVSTVISTLYKLFATSWGPRMDEVLRNSILALMEHDEVSLLEFLLLLSSPDHRERLTGWPKVTSKDKHPKPKRVLKDPVVAHFWEVQMGGLDTRSLIEVLSSSLNKIGRFLSDRRIRNVIAQRNSSFDVGKLMNEGKILLVNLSKGMLGEDNSSLLGAVLVNLILIGALQRQPIPEKQRRRFHLIVDEYQDFATATFPTLQSEARKYAIDTVVAHQFRDQLDDLNRGSTLNVANFITLRVSGPDSNELAMQFDNSPPDPQKTLQPVTRQVFNEVGGVRRELFETFTPVGGKQQFREVELPRRAYSDVQTEKANDLSTLLSYRALCRLVEGKRQLAEVITEIEPIEGLKEPKYQPNLNIAAYVRQKSLELGTPRAEVEKDIAQRIGGETRFDQYNPFGENIEEE